MKLDNDSNGLVWGLLIVGINEVKCYTSCTIAKPYPVHKFIVSITRALWQGK